MAFSVTCALNKKHVTFNFMLKFHGATNVYLAALSRYLSVCFFLKLWIFSGRDECITVTGAVGTHNSSPSLFKTDMNFSRPSIPFESKVLRITGPCAEHHQFLEARCFQGPRPVR